MIQTYSKIVSEWESSLQKVRLKEKKSSVSTAWWSVWPICVLYDDVSLSHWVEEPSHLVSAMDKLMTTALTHIQMGQHLLDANTHLVVRTVRHRVKVDIKCSTRGINQRGTSQGENRRIKANLIIWSLTKPDRHILLWPLSPPDLSFCLMLLHLLYDSFLLLWMVPHLPFPKS